LKPKVPKEEEKQELPAEIPKKQPEEDMMAKVADLSSRIQKLEAFVAAAMEEKPEEKPLEEAKAKVKEPEKNIEKKIDLTKAVESEVKKYFEKHNTGRPNIMEEPAEENKDYALRIAKGEVKFDFQKAKDRTTSAREAEIKKILGY
jgi:vacuolar-type H+-ATPase subunit I/STV1